MICKNCGDNTKGKYCHNCSQKTNTKRLTVKHFLTHDLIHGMFHLDRGLPKTILAILIRPGKVALDYIYGKRKKYYNFFYLLLLIIGLYIFIQSFIQVDDFGVKAVDESGKKLTEGIPVSDFIQNNKKVVIFSWIPVLALAGFIVFRRLKFTFVEFLIPAIIAIIGCNLFNILSILLTQLSSKFQLQDTLESSLQLLIYLLNISIFIFPIFTFSQTTNGLYSTLGKIWRMLAFYLLAVIIVASVYFGILVIINGGSPNMQIR